MGRLCYGRAYLDFNPERFVSCSSPLIELVPVVETQLVIIWGQGSPMVLWISLYIDLESEDEGYDTEDDDDIEGGQWNFGIAPMLWQIQLWIV